MSSTETISAEDLLAMLYENSRLEREVKYLESMLALAVLHAGGDVLIPQSAIDEGQANPKPVAFTRTQNDEGVRFTCRVATAEDYQNAGVKLLDEDERAGLH